VVVNLGPEQASYPLNIQGFTPAEPAQVWRLDKDTPLAAQIADQPIQPGQNLSLPGQSVSLYLIR
jgi:hypothetical protein